jgi:hypothetical protein
MTTIHIHLPGVAGTGAIIEWILSNYPQATFDVDPPTNPLIDWDAQFTRANAIVARRDADHAEKQHFDVDRIVENARAQRIMSKRLAREEDRVTDLGSKQAFYDARWAEASAARDVECPSCAAKVDHPCTTPHGKAYGAFVHVDRLRAHSTANSS